MNNETYSRLDSYFVIRNIHKGTHSKAKLIRCQKSLVHYIAHIFKHQEFLSFFNKELEILSLNLRPCVSIIESSSEGIYTKKTGEDYSCMYFIVEYMPLGNLYDVISNITLDDKTIRFLFNNILKSIKSLHSENICHRTIGFFNILFDESLNIKLSGLCYAEKANNNNHTEITANKYLAPEVIRQETYQGELADCFTLGVTLFFLKLKRLPFLYSPNGTYSYVKLFQESKEKYWRNLDRNNSVSPDLKRLIEKMIDPNPENRKSLAEIESDPWLLEETRSAESIIQEIQQRQLASLSPVALNHQSQNNLSVSFRAEITNSCSIDFLKLKKIRNFKIFRSNLFYTRIPPKELHHLVCQHALEIGANLELSKEYFQFKATANFYQELICYKVTLFEQEEFNLVDVKLIQGNEFDFYDLLNGIKRSIGLGYY